MTIGTLRDQIIYPDSLGDMNRKGIRDQHLQDLLDKVQLTYLMQREGGLDGVQDWMDVLSGGEKQRIAVSLLPKICIIISLCGRRWLDCSITNLNSPFSTNVPVLFPSMSKDSCMNTVVL